MPEIMIDESNDYGKIEKNSYNNFDEGLALINKNGNFEWFNKSFSTIIGYSEEELKKNNCFEIFLKNKITDQKKLKILLDNIINQVRENGISERFELEYINRDNHRYILNFRVWASDKDNSNSEVWVSLDNITKKKYFEEELVASEQKYHFLFDSVNIPIIILDGETRKILDTNAIRHLK
ncbi:MAG: PAS domain-containing protein [Brevinematales bacterium]